MSFSLQNPYLELTLSPEIACWSVQERQSGCKLAKARLRVDYRAGAQRQVALRTWRIQAEQATPVESPHGLLQQRTLDLAQAAGGLRLQLIFALPETQPLLLWKIAGQNQGRQPLFLDRMTLLDVAGQNLAQPAWERPAFFSNGWGSFNYSGVYGAKDHYWRTRLGPLDSPLRVNAGTPHPREVGHFSSDHFGVIGDRQSGQRGSLPSAILVGFLSQVEQFGALEAWLTPERRSLKMWANGDGVRVEPGGRFETDWACLQFVQTVSPDPLGPFLEAVFRQSWEQHRDPRKLKLSGWCSWYQYFSRVTAEDIRSNLQAAVELRRDLPLELFQIDDGYETRVGDWFSFRPTFPQGVAPLAEEIRQAGFTPGLWLAPFILDPKSALARGHPEWVLRGRWNRPVNAGFLFSGYFATALDLTAPGVLDHVQEVIDTAVHRWGFPYLKLDFLYAAALPGRFHNPHKTRAQVLREGLRAIRQAAGEETLLLGCGCPLGAGVGLVDAMRIGPDVDVRWRPAYRGIEFFFEKEPDMPSARNSLHNILSRQPLHRRWWLNDPDCLLVRLDPRRTLAEIQTLATVIALSEGALILSDDLAALPPDSLHLARRLFPTLGRAARVVDWFEQAEPCRLRADLEGPAGNWHLLAQINWADEPRPLIVRLEDYQLPPGEYWAREFWRGESWRFQAGALTWPKVPAHGVILLAVRPCTPEQPQYLGGDLHVSQGLEVSAWNWEAAEATLEFELKRPGWAQGAVDLALPARRIDCIRPRLARLDGQPLSWQQIEPGLIRFNLEFNQSALIRLELEKRP